jgi:hypothetical protein
MTMSVAGFFISALAIISRSPLIVGFMFIGIEAIPVGVLLALPKKPGSFRRRAGESR